MSKYHLTFEDVLGKYIFEYETDLEPPNMGDYVRLEKMTEGKNKNIYVVYDRWYMPIDANHVDIVLTLDERTSEFPE
jgi:hypothetical protein